jgi:hypothetical protein
MPGIRTDTSHWPLVIMTFDEGFTNAELGQCMEENAALFRRRERFVSVRDCRTIKTMPNAVQREMGAQWHKRVREEFPPLCLGVAVISDSGFIRGLMTAVSWAVTPPAPEEIFADLSSGVDWCIHKLDEGGVRVPASLRSYAVEITPDHRFAPR